MKASATYIGLGSQLGYHVYFSAFHAKGRYSDDLFIVHINRLCVLEIHVCVNLCTYSIIGREWKL
jgi:hypothetical protein